jgi:hypothetical protein
MKSENLAGVVFQVERFREHEETVNYYADIATQSPNLSERHRYWRHAAAARGEMHARAVMILEHLVSWMNE